MAARLSAQLTVTPEIVACSLPCSDSSGVTHGRSTSRSTTPRACTSSMIHAMAQAHACMMLITKEPAKMLPDPGSLLSAHVHCSRHNARRTEATHLKRMREGKVNCLGRGEFRA